MEIELWSSASRAGVLPPTEPLPITKFHSQ